jgi:hypothetical protein
MMNAVQRLRILRSEMESAQRNASAERAFEATGASDNPWHGAGEKRDALLREQRALEERAEGERGEAQSALIHWDATAQSRALLLRENPE